MRISLVNKGITSTSEVNADNIDDFIELLNSIKKKPVRVINDPNPLMCYSGDKRVLPGTNIPFIVQEWEWEVGKLKNPEFHDLCYTIGDYRFYNLTPHPVHLHNPKTGEIVEMQPCGIYPRVYRRLAENGIGDDKLFFLEENVIVNIPSAYRDVKFIVSRMVFDILPERLDLVAPNTLVRINKNGVNAVNGLVAREGVI